ncbi:MAG: hypothetical protein ACXWCU_06975 [Caldimonas sp.]
MTTTSKPTTTGTGSVTGQGRAPRLSDLIADAADLQARAAKLLADLLACKAAGGDNAYGGDLTTVKGGK